jgi:glycine cleavage system H protein
MANLNHPSDLRYTKTHEWVRVSGNEATVGISDYAQDELGDVVSIDLPWDDAGNRELQAGKHFGDIDSVKATSELFAPVSGTLVKVNESLRDAPETVNTDPYGEGWMLVIQMSDPSQVDQLMTSDQYLEFLKSQGH